jgi:hypothetical protein
LINIEVSVQPIGVNRGALDRAHGTGASTQPRVTLVEKTLGCSGSGECRAEQDQTESGADYELEKARRLTDRNAGYDDRKSDHQSVKSCSRRHEEDNRYDQH